MVFISRSSAKQCVGSGWSSLIDEAYDLFEKYGLKVTRVKEKFAQLTIYLNDWRLVDKVDGLEDQIYSIQTKSLGICEYCGEKGRTRLGPWLKTLCDECHKKRAIS